MKILISNDDGYLAPGINALADQLSSFADIVVVAPDSNRSGSSNSLTLDRPLRVMKSDKGFFSVNGTPSDCVHIALTGLLDERPDLVVSGINQGQNMGDELLLPPKAFCSGSRRLLSLRLIMAGRNWPPLRA